MSSMAEEPTEVITKPGESGSRDPQVLAQQRQAIRQELEAQEAKHWQACGKQVSSTKQSVPVYSFGSARPRQKVKLSSSPTGAGATATAAAVAANWVPPNEVRARELVQHPMIPNPSPQSEYQALDCGPCNGTGKANRRVRWLHPPLDDDDPQKNALCSACGGTGKAKKTLSPCPVLKGFGTESRFAERGVAVIKDSTLAHPLSRTYPYAEPVSKSAGGENPSQEAPPDPAAAAEAEKALLKQKQGRPSEAEQRRNGQAQPDLNFIYFKYGQRPRYGFGSSGLGSRFKPGTTFSRKPVVQPCVRHVGFRDIREQIRDDVNKRCSKCCGRGKSLTHEKCEKCRGTGEGYFGEDM